jgi:glyoxylase-like metal-dependent hydrolase (beta-lactamase superfamily II)
MTVAVQAGQVQELAAGVRRLTAPNPGMMTGPGTNTYLIGTEEVAVIDPGPVIDSHLQMIVDHADVRWIIATHTHPDHSPGTARLADMTGATVIGMPAPEGRHQDSTFCPDQIPTNGESLVGPGFELQMLHTPGHASNHLCILHEGLRWLMTGDHVMAGSTVVIDPPDGDMRDYLASLRRLRELPLNGILPGHGPLLEQPIEAIDWIISHRLEREAKVIAAVRENPGFTPHQLVPVVYLDVGAHLFEWAERSLLAHLIKLELDGEAGADKNSRWRLKQA